MVIVFCVFLFSMVVRLQWIKVLLMCIYMRVFKYVKSTEVHIRVASNNKWRIVCCYGLAKCFDVRSFPFFSLFFSFLFALSIFFQLMMWYAVNIFFFTFQLPCNETRSKTFYWSVGKHTSNSEKKKQKCVKSIERTALDQFLISFFTYWIANFMHCHRIPNLWFIACTIVQYNLPFGFGFGPKLKQQTRVYWIFM